METFKQLNAFVKAVLVTGILFIMYGYSCRLLGLYFFWESKSIGWAFLFIGIIGVLFYRIKIKKAEKQKAIPEKIAIGILCFILFVQAILITVIPFTDAYAVAKTYLASDDDLKAELGNIKGFGLIPTGGIQVTTDASGESGSATIILTVKGDKKFKDITIFVVKYADKP